MARCFSVVAFLLLVAAASTHDISNGDLGFHLAAGRDIAETGTVPRADRFSFTAADEPWMDFEWLYDLGVFTLWQHSGSAAVVLAHTLLNVLTFGILAAILFRRRGDPVIVLLLLLLVFLVCEVRFTVRPHVVERLFMVVFLAWLLAYRKRPGFPLWPLVFLQALWCNLHGTYLLAVLYSLFLVVDHALDKQPLRKPLVLSALLVAGGFITPYGWKQTIFLMGHRAEVSRAGANPEWLPLRLAGDLALDPAVLSFFLLVLAAGWVLWRRGASAGMFEWLVVLFSAVTPFVHVRMLSLSAIQLALVTAASWERGVGESRNRSGRAICMGAGFVFLGLALLFASNTYGVLFDRASRAGTRVGKMTPGWSAGAYLAQFDKVGNIFNSYRMGGWLAWWVSPRGGRVFIDGRDVGNVYPAAVLDEYRKVLLEAGVFDGVTGAYGCNAVALEHTDPLYAGLMRELAHSDEWRLAYLDEATAVFLAERFLREAAGPVTAHRGAAFLGDTGWAPPWSSPHQPAAAAMSSWSLAYSRMDLTGSATEGFAQCLEINPDDVDALAHLGTVELNEERFQEAVALLSRAVQLDPRRAGAYQNLAIAEFRVGDVAGAIRHGERAARLRPDDAMAWSNLAQFYESAGRPAKAAACRQEAGQRGGNPSER